jgi:hypothetical protein
VIDLLRRYFVSNTAPILSARRLNIPAAKFLPYRIGNSAGFYWGRWHVTWRKPYLPVWTYDSNARQWMPKS